MKTYKFIDFGSTFTKLTLIDIEKEEIVATAKSYTTVGTDVKYGYEKALNELNEKVGTDYEVVKTLACSSAAGGLKMISIGLVPDLTAEAAKRAALGAGARVIANYAFKLNSGEFEKIAISNADIILLAGGTDGGNTETIIHIAMPTPQSVLKAAEVLSKGTTNEEGVGDLVVIDVGGATTDVHSIGWGDPTKPGVFTVGLEEPFAKRTVEGDLGMRYSSMSVYEASGMRMLRKYLDISKYNPEEEYLKRYENTSFVSTTPEDIKFDEAMAKICVDISVKRHAGVVEPVYSTTGVVYSQKGKDLSDVKILIGTGGVIVNSDNFDEILSAASFRPDDLNSLKPRFPDYYVDKRYILSAMGLLTMIDPDMAIRMMKKYILDTKVQNTNTPDTTEPAMI